MYRISGIGRPHEMSGNRGRNDIMSAGLLVLIAVAGHCSTAQRDNISLAHGFPGNFTSDAAIDVQYTSCKIITDRIVATAEGKFSRFCNGICNISETNVRLHRIETLLTTHAEDIKHRLFYLERVLLADNNNTSGAVAGPRADSGRLREIGSYNGTVFVEDGPEPRRSAFVYYWRVDGWWRLALAADGRPAARSPPFYVSPRGYRVALTVRPDAAARTVRVSAVAAPGEYDAQLRWPMDNRLRISVLDQTDFAPEDIVSRVWDDVRCGGGHREGAPYCAFVEFRYDVLARRRYAADDTLLVKLTVYL